MCAQKIVIVDDHPLFRDALDTALKHVLVGCTIRQAGSLDELTALLSDDADIDAILLDLNMPGVQGFSGLLYLRAQHPAIPVMIVSATEDPATIRRAIDFGASGFVPKSQPIANIRHAVQIVLDGEVWTPPDIDLSKAHQSEDEDLIARLGSLTPQQVRVLMMLGEGLLNKQIAYQLNVSEATIKAHVSAILQKLGVDSRTQAVIAINRISTTEWQKPSAG
ncbi:MAG: response regulator transcription factor [Hyphomicrobiaceae bacterium]|nr:response regulator transcription factor [Hyphomicrobiaceae bacterium]